MVAPVTLACKRLAVKWGGGGGGGGGGGQFTAILFPANYCSSHIYLLSTPTDPYLTSTYVEQYVTGLQFGPDTRFVFHFALLVASKGSLTSCLNGEKYISAL